jgi:SPP1 gp7 family putative phage head morphogenesis protein
MIADSVFSSHLYSMLQGKEILAAMGNIEAKVLKQIEKVTRSHLGKLLKKSVSSIEAIAKLKWDLAHQVRDILLGLWDASYKTGSGHAISEMRDLVGHTQLHRSIQYSGGDRITNLIKALFTLKPIGLKDSKAAKAVQNKVMKISGGFSDWLLDRVKNTLKQGIEIPKGRDYPFTPKEVREAIANDLNVAMSRASTIGRTETTSAYNDARLETFKKSKLVTYCRFLAIDDDRITDICLTRNGMVFAVEDALKYSPSLHFNCRSTLQSLMPDIVPAHKRLVEDESLRPENRALEPLLAGWR